MLDQSNNSVSSTELSNSLKEDLRFSSDRKDVPIMAPQRKRDFARQPPKRTQSLPKRTLWKDKGGSARYVLRDVTPQEEAKPEGFFGAATKERLTDALLSGSVAGLTVLENLETAAVATKRRLDRSWSQKRLDVDASQSEEVESPEEDGSQPVESALARGRRGLLQRAKSLGSVRLGNMSSQRSTAPTDGDSTLVVSAAA